MFSLRVKSYDGRMAPLIKHLLCKPDNLSLRPSSQVKMPGLVVSTYNYSAEEIGIKGPMGLTGQKISPI